MSLMLSTTYETFWAASAPDEKAQEVAEEIAGYENRLVTVDNRLIRLEAMVAIVIAGVVNLMVKAFFVW